MRFRWLRALSRGHLSRAGAAAVLACCAASGGAAAFTVFSTTQSFMGAGTFYGPGKLPDSKIFDVTIRDVIFTTEGTFITPYRNSGAEGKHTTGEVATVKSPTGMFSDNVTTLNENADTGPFELNGMSFLAGIAGGGAHGGEQISVMHDGTMIMTMDLGLDMGIGAAGVVKFPFYGTTDEVTVPYSLQTQMGLPGGIDRAGSLPSGTKIRGRLGGFNKDGFLDGAIVVAGNMPLTSIFMPGAPYALIRSFQTDMPIDGQRVGRLLGSPEAREAARTKAALRFPEDSARFAAIPGPAGYASIATPGR